MKLCSNCKEGHDTPTSTLCKPCKKEYMKQYYIDNKQAFLDRSKEQFHLYDIESRRKYYEKNKEKILKYSKEYSKKTNYRYEKTLEQRKIRYIKRKTRYHFSLSGMSCVKCNKGAECRHHTTRPIMFDKFDFLCNKCHNGIPKIIKSQEVNKNG